MGNLFINYLWQEPFFFFTWVAVVTFSICVHEFLHAYAAYRLGDDTAARAGHLTLNPLVQMGPSSLVMLALLGIAWGAVPVQPGRLRTRGAEAAVSFAGPAANLVLCVLFGVTAGLLGFVQAAWVQPFFFFAQLGSMANGVLFLFNMLPVPMFDGWSVFALFFPPLRRLGLQQGQLISWVFLLIVFMTPVSGIFWKAGRLFAHAVMAGTAAAAGLILPH